MKKILVLLCSILLFSCAEKVIEPPEDLIPKEEMVEILRDLALLNATRTSFRAALENNEIDIMEFLFEKYGIDSLQLAESDRYYASIPLEYESIYEEVESKIAQQKKALEEIAQQKTDSVKKAQEIKRESLKKKKDSTQQKTN